MNIRKKEVFSPGVFSEFFRRMKIPGVSALVIFCLEALLIPLGTVLADGKWSDTHTVHGFGMHPILLAAIYLVAPALIFTAFGYLRSRAASDEMHAQPHTRLCLFVSAYTAAAAWLGLSIFGSSLLSWMTHVVFASHFTIYAGTLLQWSLNAFAGSLLCASATALASAVTGTALTNLIGAALIAFLPRMSLYLIGSAAVYDLSMTRYAWLPWIFHTENNIPAGFILGMLRELFGLWGSDSLSGEVAFGVGPMAYSLVLALLYAVLAAILHVRRRSECAGRPASGRLMQSALRIGVAMTLCVGVCALLYIDRSGLSSDWYLFFVLYLAAVLLYLLYELLTTRSWKKLLRALPGLGVVAALNVVCLLAIAGMHSVEGYYAPTPEEIRSVSVAAEDIAFGETLSLREYLLWSASDKAIADQDVIAFAAENLSRYALYGGQRQDDTLDRSLDRSFNIRFTTACGSRIRRIPVRTAQAQRLMEALLEDRTVSLPALRQDGALHIEQYTVPDGWDLRELYALLRLELAEVPAGTFVDNDRYAGEKPLLYLSCGVRVDSMPVTLELPVYESLTPESAAWSRRYLEAQEKQAAERICAALRDDTVFVEGSVQLLFEDGTTAHARLLSESPDYAEFCAYLRAHTSGETVDEDSCPRAVFRVQLCREGGQTEQYRVSLQWDFRSAGGLDGTPWWTIYD